MQQTGKTSLHLVSPTCSLRVGSSNGTNKLHSSRSLRRQLQTSSCLQRMGHRDGFVPSSNKVCTKARTPGKRQRKQKGRSGSNFLVRCWFTRPHQWVPCLQISPAIYSSWVRAAEQQHSGHVSVWLPVSHAKGFPTELQDCCEEVGFVSRVHILSGEVRSVTTALKVVEEVQEEVQEIEGE